MDIAEGTKIVFSRIKEIEPENALKIVAQILMHHTETDIVEYARGSDQMIQLLIREAKASLLSSSKLNASAPLLPPVNRSPSFMSPSIISRRLSYPSTCRVPAPAPYMVPHHVSDEPPPLRSLHIPPSSYNEAANQGEFASLEGQLQSPSHLGQLQSPNHLGQLQSPNYLGQLHSPSHFGRELSSNFHHMNAAVGGGLVGRTDMRSPLCATEFPCRSSPYFCGHDMNYKHPYGQGVPNSLSPLQNLGMNELINDDHVFALESLQKLEMEIVELLRARKGAPVSIASLPMVYHEMYGKTLQADGYVTESQRHVRTGYNLTKLLARLNHICLLDRPHGQHSVVLAEDAPKYMEYRNERSDSGSVPGSSHQIYLTFPAESTFTKDEVSDYFMKYGPVCDVRIPRQEKRMFGFVSFLHAETVTRILMEGHPHYICGARVLVKPYKEKSTINDRKYMEKIENPISYSPYTGMDPSPHSFPGARGGPTLLERGLIQSHEQVLELERRRLLEVHLSQNSLIRHPFFGNMTSESRSTEDQSSSVPDQISSPTTDENARNTSSRSNDQDSEHIELPESPFTSQ